MANIKWSDGFKCVKCSHSGTASANTLFHKVKFGLRKAFFMCFEMSTTIKSLSASYTGVRFGVTEVKADKIYQTEIICS